MKHSRWKCNSNFSESHKTLGKYDQKVFSAVPIFMFIAIFLFWIKDTFIMWINYVFSDILIFKWESFFRLFLRPLLHLICTSTWLLASFTRLQNPFCITFPNPPTSPPAVLHHPEPSFIIPSPPTSALTSPLIHHPPFEAS